MYNQVLGKGLVTSVPSVILFLLIFYICLAILLTF